MFDLIIRDATIVSAARREVADVAIRGDKIAYVGPRPPRPARSEISAMGRFLVPGVIDSGLQFGGAGLPEVITRETRAAVTGGVTTVLGLPEPAPSPQTAGELRESWRDAARHSFCDLGWWVDDRQGPSSSIDEVVSDGWVVGTLATLDEGEATAERIDRWRTVPGLLALHWRADDAPPTHLLDAVRERASPAHLYALASNHQLDWLDPVRHDVSLTSTVTLPHLFLSADESDASTVVADPPLRSEQERRTLWTATKRGRLDCVASHHHVDPKRGVAGSEVLLPLMLHAAQTGRLSLEQVVDLCCEGPARLFGLSAKGRVRKGFDADLVLFSESSSRRIEPHHLLSRGESPYVGREAASKPDLVFVGGQLVAESGQLVGEHPVGRALAAGRAA